MNIKTRFNVGDTVCTIDKDTLKFRDFEVESVYAYATDKNCRIKYKAKGDSAYADSYDENVCFTSREELLTHITE